jgi:hypothetical protein
VSRTSLKSTSTRARIIEDRSSARQGIRSFTVELSERQAAGLRTNVREIPGFKSAEKPLSKG